MSVGAGCEDINLREMRQRSAQTGTELSRQLQLHKWSTAKKPVSPVLRRGYRVIFVLVLYSARCRWVIEINIVRG